jgi:ketosteroid isomerase-like protein
MTIPQRNMMSAQQPEELHRLFVECVNAHNIDGLLALYEQDSTVADLEGRPLRGIDSLRAFLLGFLSAVKQIDGATRKVLVAGDIALLSSTYHATLTAYNGETTSITGTSAEVARRQPDGTWRFLIDDPQFMNTAPQS